MAGMLLAVLQSAGLLVPQLGGQYWVLGESPLDRSLELKRIPEAPTWVTMKGPLYLERRMGPL